MKQGGGMRAPAVVVGVVAVLCLGAAGAGLALAARTPGAGQVSLWQAWQMQRTARIRACDGYERTVAGSYAADAVRRVGEHVVVTYSAECVQRGGQVAHVIGYMAESENGGCGGGGGVPAGTAPAGVTRLDGLGSGGCGVPGSGGVRVAYGWVSGTAAATVEVAFADGVTAAAPVRNGRFAMAVPGVWTACLARALDSSGGLLAAEQFSGGPGVPSMGVCP